MCLVMIAKVFKKLKTQLKNTLKLKKKRKTNAKLRLKKAQKSVTRSVKYDITQYNIWKSNLHLNGGLHQHQPPLPRLLQPHNRA